MHSGSLGFDDARGALLADHFRPDAMPVFRPQIPAHDVEIRGRLNRRAVRCPGAPAGIGRLLRCDPLTDLRRRALDERGELADAQGLRLLQVGGEVHGGADSVAIATGLQVAFAPRALATVLSVDLDAIQEHRRTRFQALIDSPEFAGNLSAVGRALGYQDGVYVRQMRDGERPISEKTVLKIEALAGRGGWFDHADEFEEASETDFAMLQAFKGMSDDDRADMLKDAVARADKFQKLTQEALRKAAGRDTVAPAQAKEPAKGKSGFRYIKKTAAPAKKATVRKKAG